MCDSSCCGCGGSWLPGDPTGHGAAALIVAVAVVPVAGWVADMFGSWLTAAVVIVFTTAAVGTAALISVLATGSPLGLPAAAVRAACTLVRARAQVPGRARAALPAAPTEGAGVSSPRAASTDVHGAGVPRSDAVWTLPVDAYTWDDD